MPRQMRYTWQTSKRWNREKPYQFRLYENVWDIYSHYYCAQLEFHSDWRFLNVSSHNCQYVLCSVHAIIRFKEYKPYKKRTNFAMSLKKRESHRIDFIIGITFAPRSFETRAWGKMYKDTTYNYVHSRRMERCANEANRHIATGIFTSIVAIVVTTEDCFCVFKLKMMMK